MANIRLTNAAANAMINALTALIDAAVGSPSQGYIEVYSGTQPTNGGDPLSGNTLLATLRWSDTPFGAGSAGVATANPIIEDSAADATGTAAWARVKDADGNIIFDCDVGTSGATINFNTVNFVQNGPVRISSFTLTMPKS